MEREKLIWGEEGIKLPFPSPSLNGNDQATIVWWGIKMMDGENNGAKRDGIEKMERNQIVAIGGFCTCNHLNV
jgi:hypothetical protein